MAEPALGDQARWEAWQRSWDQQQERGIGDREERLGVLVSLAGEAGSDSPRVLDLACGCGSVTSRLLLRHPQASVVALDLDPVLLRIARGVLGRDPRVRLVEADLRSEDWVDRLGGATFDIALTATALHWLSPERLVDLYRALVGRIRPGGVFANADHMAPGPGPQLTRLATALDAPPGEAGLSWEDWWAEVGKDPELGQLLPQRQRRFGFGLHPAEFNPPAAWHLAQLVEAGFVEAGEVWRRGNATVVVATR
ncbi:MAG: class I SAM-dependent methyltransferase [Candidatus Dormibacteria bacterium]